MITKRNFRITSCVVHGDGPFVSVPLFMSVSPRGRSFCVRPFVYVSVNKGTDTKGPSLCFSPSVFHLFYEKGRFFSINEMPDMINKTVVILRTLFSFICPQHFMPVSSPNRAKGMRRKTDLTVPSVNSPSVL